MKPETKFRVSKIDPFLKTLLNTYYEAIQQKGKSGTLDYFLCCRGLFVGLEVKSAKGGLTPLQLFKVIAIEKRGKGIALVVWPDTFEQVQVILTKMDKGENYEDELQRYLSVSVPNRNAKT